MQANIFFIVVVIFVLIRVHCSNRRLRRRRTHSSSNAQAFTGSGTGTAGWRPELGTIREEESEELHLFDMDLLPINNNNDDGDVYTRDADEDEIATIQTNTNTTVPDLIMVSPPSDTEEDDGLLNSVSQELEELMQGILNHSRPSTQEDADNVPPGQQPSSVSSVEPIDSFSVFSQDNNYDEHGDDDVIFVSGDTYVSVVGGEEQYYNYGGQNSSSPNYNSDHNNSYHSWDSLYYENDASYYSAYNSNDSNDSDVSLWTAYEDEKWLAIMPSIPVFY